MTYFVGKTVLVTGGAGFIGSHLVDGLIAAGASRIAVVDNLFLGEQANLETARSMGGAEVILHRENAGDPHSMRAIAEDFKPDIVFNLATKALPYSFSNPAEAFRVNTEVALVWVELLRYGGFQRLIHFSTSEVYGTAQSVPMREDHALLAETSYAAGKAAADHLLKSYANMFGLDIVTIRPFNNYGPRQNSGAYSAVIPLTVRRILDGQAPVIYGDGTQTRDFMFVGDTVSATLKLAGDETAPGEVFNLGSGRETAISEVIGVIVELMGYRGEIERQPARPADVMRHLADVGKAGGRIGDVAPTELSIGLEKTVEWYRQ